MKYLLKGILIIEIILIFFFSPIGQTFLSQLKAPLQRSQTVLKKNNITDKEVMEGLRKSVSQLIHAKGTPISINGGKFNTDGILNKIQNAENGTSSIYNKEGTRQELVGVTVDGDGFIPLYRKNTQGIWEPTSLSFFGEENKILIGTSSIDRYTTSEKELLSQYNSVTLQDFTHWPSLTPMNEETVHAEQDLARKQVAFFKSAGIKDIRIHALIYPQIMPSWIREGRFTKKELLLLMKRRIEYVMGLYPNATSFVVVNEPSVPNNGRESNDVFYKAWGNYEYITDAFQIARSYATKHNRTASLIFNDGDNHYSTGPTRDITRDIVTMLKERNLIDSVGMQMHIGNWARGAEIDINVMFTEFKNELEYYKKIGVPVLLTEVTYSPTERELRQGKSVIDEKVAHVFGTLVAIAVSAKNVEGITTWGFTDKYLQKVSWYQLYDEQEEPKKAYYEVLKALYKGAIMR